MIEKFIVTTINGKRIPTLKQLDENIAIFESRLERAREDDDIEKIEPLETAIKGIKDKRYRIAKIVNSDAPVVERIFEYEKIDYGKYTAAQDAALRFDLLSGKTIFSDAKYREEVLKRCVKGDEWRSAHPSIGLELFALITAETELTEAEEDFFIQSRTI
jgi:hypothetical protein